MTLMRISGFLVLLLFTAFGTQGHSQTAMSQNIVRGKNMRVTDPCLMVKGGLGIVNPGLYIDVNSEKNKLLFGKDESWSGLDWSESEIVAFFANKVWTTHSLPRDFDLSKAVIISFERERVRFFDFQAGAGCYYHRSRE
jgi:hypothetical protein